MKKRNFVLIVMLLVVCGSIFAEDVIVKITTTTGEILQEVYYSGRKTLQFFGGDSKKYRISKIEGLEQLTQLELIEFINIPDIKDFSFLASISSLQKIYFRTTHVNSLSFLSELINLEEIELETVYISAEYADYLSTNIIDLSKLTKIKKITCGFAVLRNSRNRSLNFVPPFANVKNQPVADFNNNNIEFFTERDIKLLKQYSNVILYFNPVYENSQEMAKLISNDIHYEKQYVR